MWKSPFCSRPATFFSPQGNVGKKILFHRGCGCKNPSTFVHRFYFHIPQELWIIFGMQNSKCGMQNLGMPCGHNF
jgi:hypothetical protein